MSGVAPLGPVLVVAGLLWSYIARTGDAAGEATPAGALVLLALGAVLIASRLVRQLGGRE